MPIGLVPVIEADPPREETREMKRFRHLLVLLFAFSLVAVACGDDDAAETTTTTTAATTTTTAATTTTTSAPEEEKTLIIGTTDAISSLDGADAYAVHDWELLKNIGEGLIRWEPGSGDVLVPGAAQDLGSFSEDGLSYTIQLLPDLVFGDGTPLDAQTYADQINNRLLVLEGPNGVGPALGQPYVESVEAVDDLTIKFNLTGTWAFFPQLLAGAPYIPTNPTQFGAELNLFPEAPIYGNGPWYIESYDPAEQLVLLPNELYHGEAPALDRVIIRYFGDPQTMALAVESGEIDVAWRILGPELIAQLEEVDGLNVGTIDAGPIRYLIVNHVLAPTDDPNVRSALASLVDRDELSDRVFGGAVTPLYSQVPPGFLGATEAFDTMYGAPDIAAATAYLALAGYTEASPLQLTMTYPPEHYGAETADIFEVLKEQFEASGAIEVSLDPIEWSTYVGILVAGTDYAVGFLGWFYDYPDPDNYLSPFIMNGGLGTMVTDPETGAVIESVNPELLSLLVEAAANGDQAARADLYGQIQEIYASEVVTIPLFIQAEHIVYRDGVVADTGFSSPGTLNIGPTVEFNYITLDLG